MPEPTQERIYNLEQRTLKFSQSLIDFCNKLPHNTVATPMISQLVRSGTSIGANYHEATEGSSKKDFTNKIYIAKKEAKETKFWIQLLAHAIPKYKDDLRVLWKEAQELTLILAAISRKSRK